jgi:hypothetical protein
LSESPSEDDSAARRLDVAVADNDVVDDEHTVGDRIDVDPVSVVIVVDDIVSEELVDPLEVDAVALVERARPVVVDRVPDDLEVVGRALAEDPLVGGVALLTDARPKSPLSLD